MITKVHKKLQFSRTIAKKFESRLKFSKHTRAVPSEPEKTLNLLCEKKNHDNKTPRCFLANVKS